VRIGKTRVDLALACIDKWDMIYYISDWKTLGERLMSTASNKLANLVIPSGTNVSNIWKAREVYEDAVSVFLTGENVTDGVITYTVEVTDDFEPSASGTWSTLQDAGADYAPALQGKAKALPQVALAATGIRIKSSANVTADRTWGATKQYGAAPAFDS